jgi:hypothetical protein
MKSFGATVWEVSQWKKQGQCMHFSHLHGLNAKSTCRVLPTFCILANPTSRVGYPPSLWPLACITYEEICSFTGSGAWCLSETQVCF